VVANSTYTRQPERLHAYKHRLQQRWPGTGVGARSRNHRTVITMNVPLILKVWEIVLFLPSSAPLCDVPFCDVPFCDVPFCGVPLMSVL
jgi:hypothetical protein